MIGQALYFQWLAHYRDALGLPPISSDGAVRAWEAHSEADHAAWVALAAKSDGPITVGAGRAVRVDLTGSRLGPGWRSVVNLGDWPESWDDDHLRAEAAAHYEVPVEQVRIVPDGFEEPDDGEEDGR